jgi:hypothetical protein
MWSNRIVMGAVIAVIVIAAVDAFRSRDHDTTAHATTAATTPRNVAPVRRCAPGDLAVAIEIRRPSRVQTSGGVFAATRPRRRVATIVVRNVRAPPCLFASGGFHLTISDRTGKVIGEWNDDPRRGLVWFAHTYSPGSEKTFSLPTVYRCDRPGPFVAVATVGSNITLRGYLSRRQITC